MPYADGTFTSFKQQGPTRVSYPLLNYPTKDKTVKQYTVTGWVLPSSYTPANALSTYPGDGTLAADNVAYLTAEIDPRDGGGYYVVERAYTNIPNAQTRWGSQLFVTPSMHDITVSNYYGVSFDDNATTHIFTTRKAVQAVGNPNLTSGLRSIQCDGHSTASGKRVALYNGDDLFSVHAVQYVADANVFSILNDEFSDANTVSITHAAFADNAAARYVNGPVPVSTKITETFYLPGVSAGITTPADITLAAAETDPVSWLSKIASSATYAVVDGAELEQWQGPIFRVTKTELDMSDAKVSVAVGA